MNKLKISTMSTLLLSAALTGCQNGLDTQSEVIERPEVTVVDGKITPEILEAFGRINEATVSPDGKKVAFTVAYEDIAQNKANAEVYVMNIDGTEITRLTHTPGSEANVRWIENGRRLAFISKDPKTDKNQIFTIFPDGRSARAISEAPQGVDCFEFAPNGSRVVYGAQIKPFNKNEDVLKGLPLTTGRVVDDLMYKHWDEWVTEIPHPFVADFDGSKLGAATDIMEGEPYECPMKPFGGAETFAWSPDGSQLVYTSRKLAGQAYAFSTDSNLYLYDFKTKSTKCLTESTGQGYDTNPVFSPDGSHLAWMSMETPKFESDQNRLLVMDMASGKIRNLTAEAGWDYSVEGLKWTPDGKDIVLNAYYQGTMPIFKVNVANPQFRIVAEGVWDYVSPEPLADGRILALRHNMSRPNEICLAATDGTVADISHVNDELIGKLKLGKVEKRMVPTTDGKEMCTWVVYPPDFDPNKKYPALLYCQGGPQQAVSQFWSYRWNFQIMASNGYIIICPNRRGLPGFGTEWNRQISGDYGGQNMRDYFSAVDDMKRESYIDADHIGAIGASYGGFSVYWLAGHHEGRFAALVAHAGIFNMEAQYLETEEMWFADFDMGGAYWDSNNATAQRTFANSPHRFVNNWTAPILVTVGELDYRILASQGMQAFNAAKMHGLEAEMLVFPDENHWVIKPQNAILWQRVFFRFLDKYLKPGTPGYRRPAAPKAATAATATTAQPDSTKNN